jgi:hypothetical protein
MKYCRDTNFHWAPTSARSSAWCGSLWAPQMDQILDQAFYGCILYEGESITLMIKHVCIYIYVLINTYIIIYIYMYIYIYIFDVSKTFWGCSNTMWVVCADNNGYSTLSKQATNTGYYRTNMWGIELEHERPLKTMGTCIYWYWYLDK